MKRILPFAIVEFKKFLKLNIEYHSIIHSYLRKNELLPFYIRQKSILSIINICKKYNVTRLLYVCTVTGKSQAVNTNFRMSNLTFKLFIKKGVFSGMVK